MSAANDAHLLALLRLVREHPEPAKAAMQRMTQRAADLVAKLLEEGRARARLQPLKLQLARECFLDPTLLDDGPTVFGKKEAGFDSPLVRVGHPIPRWMTRARELGLYVDVGAGRELGSGIDMFRQAREKGIDITAHSPAECYLQFQFSFRTEESTWSDDDIRAVVDPAFVRPNSMPLSVHLSVQLKVELQAPSDVSRTAAQWWEVAVLILLFTHADFDGASVGLDPPIPWENIPGDSHYGWARRNYDSEIRERQDAFDKLLARTVLYLSELTPKVGSEGEGSPAANAIDHAADFTWLRVGTATYEFKKGRQAQVIAALFESWHRAGRVDGRGLTEATLSEKAGSSGSFRMLKVFEHHPALRTILSSPSKGVWALFLNKSATA